MLDSFDKILVEAPLAPLQALVEGLEQKHTIAILRRPEVCLTLLRAEDSLDHQEFLLGEALTTACDVSVDGVPGYGLCLGEEPARAYCIAVLDSLREQQRIDAATQATLDSFAQAIDVAERTEFAQVLRTQVDFKLLEQE